MTSFDKISENLNTSFSAAPDIQQIQKDLDHFQEKKNQIKTFIEEKKDITLEDKGFLQLETKILIHNGKAVLDKLQEEIKQGSSPRIYEVYSQLMSTVMGGLRKLRELNKMVLDIERINKMTSDPGQGNTTVNVFMSSKDMAEMMKKAKVESSMNAVDGTFSEVKD